ncbi:MAG TPA: hypothetical protein VIN59_00825 [Alphaproteobacteria bacterium]
MTQAATRPTMTSAIDLPGLYRDFVPGLDAMVTNDMTRQKDVLSTAKLLTKQSHDTPGLARLLFDATGFGGPQNWTLAIAGQFLSWRRDAEDSGGHAHLAEILKMTCTHFGVRPSHPLLPAAAMASVIGAVPNDLPFHSAHHTREVVALTMALSAQQHAEKPFEDPQTQGLELFIGACIHDFAHDGFGNARHGQHTPMRLEQNALDHALPFLKIAHIPDPSWERICVMVLSTDVSKPAASYTSPAEWMRIAYQGINDDSDECPPFLSPLFDDSTLAMQSAILEDADLGVSGGTPYEFARRMTALIAEETKVLSPSPETLIGFIDHICHGSFMTPAAKTLFGDSMKRLRTAAKEESADTIYQWS